ncbi:MAG TPA: M67 family metallopeptidase [Acidimicrobiia bacterium]|nr:M67 family metallopeptidase [Acidimicrobiia bacterium]
MTRFALSDHHRRSIVEHCVEALPDEGCGLLAMEGDRVAAVYPTENEDRSPSSYTIPPRMLYEAVVDAESRGWEVGGVFHSHPVGPAAMSGTDLARVTDPAWLYLVVSLAGPEPVLTGWSNGEEVKIS